MDTFVPRRILQPGVVAQLEDEERKENQRKVGCCCCSTCAVEISFVVVRLDYGQIFRVVNFVAGRKYCFCSGVTFSIAPYQYAPLVIVNQIAVNLDCKG